MQEQSCYACKAEKKSDEEFYDFVREQLNMPSCDVPICAEHFKKLLSFEKNFKRKE